MEFNPPLKSGQFLKRYKRFFADIEKDGEVITAHCPNTGSMKGLKEQPTECRFSVNDDPKRKLKATLEMIKTETSWVGVNTALPNKLVYELWASGQAKHWKPFDRAQAEVKISDKSRIDLVLWEEAKAPEIKKLSHKIIEKDEFPMHMIEVKNVTLAEGKTAMFPDAVTERGQKHIIELMELMDRGYTCEFVFTVQREDCTSFTPAADIDPEYARLLKEAHKKGLIISAFPCKLTESSIELIPKSLPIKF